MTTGSWLNWAAIGTWLVVSLQTLAAIWAGRMPAAQAVVWVTAFLTFGALVSLCVWTSSAGRTRGVFAIMLLAQTLAGLVMVVTGRDGSAGATLVIVAAQLPHVLPLRAAGWWVAAQTLALAAIFGRDGGWVQGVSAGFALGGFQVFAVATSSLALSERRAREALTRANIELNATRELLAENSRVAERLRISRDLHDTLGHHLTALSLQLDVASRLASGTAAEHVREAHAIVRLLLGDVRNVVSTLRDGGPIDLTAAIRRLADAPAGTLSIHLDLPGSLVLDDAAQANALLRCVQEVITNAARHAAARNLWLRLAATPEGIELRARDDGRGVDAVTWGHGLKGMRERFQERAGRVDIVSGAGQGFEVRAFMPRTEPA